MKKILLGVLLVSTIVLAGCSQSSDNKLAQKQEELMSQAVDQVSMPAIVNFQERKLAKQIMELRDQANLVTYTYVVNFDGKPVFLCNSIGFGLPYSVQYTNPQKRYETNGGLKLEFTIPQADPNGLYMPEGLDATWVMCVDPKTQKPTPMYVEQDVLVSPFRF